jgi:hypothetical protein
MMTTTQLITSNDPKGQDAVAKFCAAYNKMGFNPEAAQRLNESGKFWQGLKTLMGQHSVSNQFASEEAHSSYTYPKEYRGLKPIGEQVDIIAKAFGLSLGYTSEWIEKVLPTLTLPEGAEGWCALPSVDAVAKRHFPEVTDPVDKYCRADEFVLEKLGKSRRFYNYREGEMTPRQLRQHARTLHALDVIAETQKGDILIVAVQCGMRHRGRSVRRARECFIANEFGFGALHVGAIALTHPERYVRWEQLHTDCAGDEFAPVADGEFWSAPIFLFDDDGLKFRASVVSSASERYGSVSGFLPQ